MKHVYLQLLLLFHEFLDLLLEFANASYMVSERQSHVDVQVTLLVNIERNITLDLVTSDRTAMAGENEYRGDIKRFVLSAISTQTWKELMNCFCFVLF